MEPTKEADLRPPLVGLILSGGGARAAYQVGVLRAVARMLPPGAPNPFPILCGTSAGAINATAIAAGASHFHEAVRQLEYFWRHFHVGQVYGSTWLELSRSAGHWLLSFFLGGLGRHNPRSLLNNTPLRELLGKKMNFNGIQQAIDHGSLRALSITVAGYTSEQSLSFFQGVPELTPWKRARRIGSRAQIGLHHLMASSAIPVVFPAERINREYFGDGSLRQSMPISPALHFGAERVLVVGVSPQKREAPDRVKVSMYPSLAQVAGQLLNGNFLDALEVDLERLERVNRTVRLIPEDVRREQGLELRKVDVLVISPSQDLEPFAGRFRHHFPPAMRFFLRGLGALRPQGTVLASYLLFEKPYCRALMRLGYRDTMARKQDILSFLGYSEAAPATATAGTVAESMAESGAEAVADTV